MGDIACTKERLKAFGHPDHVRRYGITAEKTFEDPSIVEPEGPDYIDRLREVGFSVEVTKGNDLVQNDEAIRMGLTSAAGEIYYCTK